MKHPCVYVITNKHNTTLYVGVTSNLVQRMQQHKNKQIDGFSKRYNLFKLVYFESVDSMEQAIIREERLKNWHREWKNKLVNAENPTWSDLFEKLI